MLESRDHDVISPSQQNLNLSVDTAISPELEQVEKLLSQTSPDDMTPKQALEFVYQLKRVML